MPDDTPRSLEQVRAKNAATAHDAEIRRRTVAEICEYLERSGWSVSAHHVRKQFGVSGLDAAVARHPAGKQRLESEPVNPANLEPAINVLRDISVDEEVPTHHRANCDQVLLEVFGVGEQPGDRIESWEDLRNAWCDCGGPPEAAWDRGHREDCEGVRVVTAARKLALP